MQMQEMAPEQSPWEEATGKKVRRAFSHSYQLLINVKADAQPAVSQPSRKRGRSSDDDGDDERIVRVQLR
jgi:hypothetical protein